MNEEPDKQTDESKTKWAAETYAFLALFRRLRRRLAGLLIMEFGWALLLNLVGRFGTKDEAAAINWPGPHGLVTLPLATVFTIGAVVIFLIWMITSGFWQLLYLPLARAIRPLISRFLLFASFTIVIVSAPILLPAFLFNYWRFQRWLRTRDSQWLAKQYQQYGEQKLVEQHQREFTSDKTQIKSFNEWKAAKGQKWVDARLAAFTNPALWDTFEKEVSPQILRLLNALGNWVTKQRIRLDSTALIGLAPFFSYSFEEEQRSAKAPLQIFAGAIRHLRLSLADADIFVYIRFIIVPEVVRIESEDAARFWRMWLGLDTLLWGSYVSATPPRIWLNLEGRKCPSTKPRPSPVSVRDDSSNSSYDIRRRWDPVVDRDLDDPMMLINQDNPIDCYLVVLACFFRTLRCRPKPRKLLFISSTDRLQSYTYSAERSFLEMAIPLFTHLKKELPPREIDTTPSHMLVDHVSNWVASEILESTRFRKANLWAMYNLLQHCIRLMPGEPEHHYRLGAVLCLLEQTENAFKAFDCAQKVDLATKFHNPEEVSSYAQFEVEYYSSGGLESGQFAALVALVARALVLAGPDVAPKLREIFHGNTYFRAMKFEVDGMAVGEVPSAWVVLWRLFDRTSQKPIGDEERPAGVAGQD